MAKSSKLRDSGAAAVEFALVIPMLLLVVFGLIDFGRMLNAQITVTEAAREGARADAISPPVPNPLTSVVQPRVDLASQELGPPRTVDADLPGDCLAGAGDAHVTTSYEFKFVTPIGFIAAAMGGTFGGDLEITGVGVMPCGG